MGKTLTVRLPPDLLAWLEETSRKTGIPRGRLVRDALEAERRRDRPAGFPGFGDFIGCMEGPRNLSSRKGYSRS